MIPDLRFEVAFGVDLQDEPTTWTDLSSRLRTDTLSWEYGRDAGTGLLVLDNHDGHLTPENPLSPFWPDVEPMAHCRLTAIIDSDEYPVMEGFVENWTPQLRGQADLVVIPDLVDAWMVYAQAQTSVGFSMEKSGERIDALLDVVGWPSAKRDLDTGNTILQEYDASQRIVANAVKDAVEAEQGLLVVGPDGVVTFHERHRRINGGSPVATFAGATTPSDAPYRSTVPRFGVESIWNDIQVEPTDRGLQRVSDTDSRDRFGHRWLPLSDLPIELDLVALDLAGGILLETKDPHLVIESMTLYGHRSEDVLVQCLERRVGDKITLTPEYGGPRDLYIGGVAHTVTGDTWTTRWALEPVSVYDGEWWILNTSPIEVEVGGVPPARLGW